jgi:hypothetical protein
MQTKILDLIKTDHELLKEWKLGLSDSKLNPIISRIEKPVDHKKKIVFVLPSFLNIHGIDCKNKLVMIMVIKGSKIVTTYYCSHPNYLFKKEKESEFQIIY